MTENLRILVPTDDSPSALRAVDHVIGMARLGLAVEVHLLNVQAPLRGTATLLIGQAARDDYHREEGMKVLARAQRKIEQAGLPVHLHVSVGEPGETVLVFARRLGCHQIVMGTRGLSGVAELIIGSVARHVAANSEIPVTLVRA